MPMSYVYTLLEYYNSKKTVTKKSKLINVTIHSDAWS